MPARRALSVALICCLLTTGGAAQALTGVAQGHVWGIDGTPIGGATVWLVGTGLVTVAMADGSFRLSGIPLGRQRLMARFVGKTTRCSEPFVVNGVDTTLWEPRLLTYPIVAESLRVVSRDSLEAMRNHVEPEARDPCP